jgi:hypothetical protein
MLSSPLSYFSARLGESKSKSRLVAVGVVIAAAAALLFGDAHSIGMTHD